MKKMSTITIIALGLIFLGGIGAILLAIGQADSASKDKTEIIDITKQENVKLKNNIEELKRERDKLSTELTNRDSILQRKNDIIIELNQKLSAKSEYMQNYLTGGHGYPILDIEKFGPDNFSGLTGLFNLKSVSKFPIYNITINVFDYDLLQKSIKKVPFSNNLIVTLTDFNNAKILSTKFNELSPSQTRFLDKKIKLQDARYYIQLQARNNAFIEKIVLLIHNAILYFGYQIFTIDEKLIEQNFGENTSEEVKALMIHKLNTISLTNNFDLIEK
jgi:cell division protein FtsB